MARLFIIILINIFVQCDALANQRLEYLSQKLVKEPVLKPEKEYLNLKNIRNGKAILLGMVHFMIGFIENWGLQKYVNIVEKNAIIIKIFIGQTKVVSTSEILKIGFAYV